MKCGKYTQLSEDRTLFFESTDLLGVTATHSLVICAVIIFLLLEFQYLLFLSSIQFFFTFGVWSHWSLALVVVVLEVLIHSWEIVVWSCTLVSRSWFATTLKDLVLLSHLVDLGWGKRLSDFEGLFFHLLVALLLPAALSFKLAHIEKTRVYAHRFRASQVSSEKVVVLVAYAVAGILLLCGIELCLSRVIWIICIRISQLV